MYGRYTYRDMKMHLYDTFGFTVLGALSYGFHFIINGIMIGGKEILSEGTDIVIKNINYKNYALLMKI